MWLFLSGMIVGAVALFVVIVIGLRNTPETDQDVLVRRLEEMMAALDAERHAHRRTIAKARWIPGVKDCYGLSSYDKDALNHFLATAPKTGSFRAQIGG